MEASWNLWRARNPKKLLNVALSVANNDAVSTPASAAVVISVCTNDVTDLVGANLQVHPIVAVPVASTAPVTSDTQSVTTRRTVVSLAKSRGHI